MISISSGLRNDPGSLPVREPTGNVEHITSYVKSLYDRSLSVKRGLSGRNEEGVMNECLRDGHPRPVSLSYLSTWGCKQLQGHVALVRQIMRNVSALLDKAMYGSKLAKKGASRGLYVKTPGTCPACNIAGAFAA